MQSQSFTFEVFQLHCSLGINLNKHMIWCSANNGQRFSSIVTLEVEGTTVNAVHMCFVSGDGAEDEGMCGN